MRNQSGMDPEPVPIAIDPPTPTRSGRDTAAVSGIAARGSPNQKRNVGKRSFCDHTTEATTSL